MTRVWMHKETGELILSEALYRDEEVNLMVGDLEVLRTFWQCGWIITNQNELSFAVSVDVADYFEDLGDL